MVSRRSGFILFFLMLQFVSFGQYFGGHPTSMKWNQVNTDSIRIIFPHGFEKQAQSIARITHAIPFFTGKSIGSTVKKMDIVLQPYSTISNGYVSLGPRRSEFILTPLQNSFELGSVPWPVSLALHEYRHIQQYNNFRKGVSRAFYYLFGQQGQELANNAAVPNWFWEGDAVLQETILSSQGRGRLPWFFNGFKSLDQAGKNYSWMKLRNGSFRDYTPSHYQLGYQLVTYGREKFGEDFWQKVTDEAVRFHGVFYPFQKAIKKHAGISFKKFRTDALEYFRDSIASVETHAQHFIANEEFPQWIDSIHLVYAYSSYRQVPAFRILNIKDGTERELRKRDINLDGQFSYRNGKIVYAAYEPDTRWGWRDYSDIRLIDVASGRQQSITHHTKYFSPDINNAGNRIIAVHAGADGTNALHLLTINADQYEITIIPNRNGYVYTYPKFFDEQHLAVAVRDTLGRMSIALVDSEDGTAELLTPWVYGVTGFLQVKKDTIVFSASHGNHDRLFCIAGKKIFLLQSEQFNTTTGDYQPAIGEGKIAWTTFTAAGLQIGIAKKDEIQMTSISEDDFNKPFQANAERTIPPQLKEAEGLFSSNGNTLSVSRYRNTTSILNFHSWRPVISDPEYTFSLLSENTLNSLQGELYFTYNRNEQSKKAGFTATYGGLFPWIRAGTNYTVDRSANINGSVIHWNEWEVSTGLLVPLNLTTGRYYRSLSAGSDIIFNKSFFKGPLKDSFDNRAFAYFNHSINFSNQVQRARLQIYPRWAQTISAKFSHAVTELKGRQFQVTADWFLPGIGFAHSLVVNTAFHLRDTMNNVRFSNSFPFSRGYIGENFQKMIKAGAEYHFPIVYPDWGFASLVYFQRIRADVFFDLTFTSDYTSGEQVENNYKSFGTEIYFDTKWWNQEPVSFGIRYSYLLNADLQNIGKHQWEIIIPVNLFNN